jgi:hypothetical protein
MSRLDHVVLNISAYPVLWAEKSRQVDPRVLGEKVGSVPKAMIDRSLVTDQPHPLVSEERIGSLEGIFKTETN